jgi:vitamin B12/bleomycin/antimicrobial peptide transport system ATP-binding/permease protein
MQTAAAFGQVQDSLSFVISSYTVIAAWRSVVEQLVGFERALKVVRVQMATTAGIRHTARDGEGLVVDGVELNLPAVSRSSRT